MSQRTRTERTPHERDVARRVLAELGKKNVPTEFVERVLDGLFEFRATTRSEAIREGIAARKRRGLYRSRWPGYGWRWDARGRRVPDENERQTIRRIVTWREQGAPWEQIARRLMLDRVETSDGREWSVSRIRRVWAAARSWST